MFFCCIRQAGNFCLLFMYVNAQLHVCTIVQCTILTPYRKPNRSRPENWQCDCQRLLCVSLWHSSGRNYRIFFHFHSRYVDSYRPTHMYFTHHSSDHVHRCGNFINIHATPLSPPLFLQIKPLRTWTRVSVENWKIYVKNCPMSSSQTCVTAMDAPWANHVHLRPTPHTTSLWMCHFQLHSQQ